MQVKLSCSLVGLKERVAYPTLLKFDYKAGVRSTRGKKGVSGYHDFGLRKRQHYSVEGIFLLPTGGRNTVLATITA
jgi:hypothetical protein